MSSYLDCVNTVFQNVNSNRYNHWTFAFLQSDLFVWFLMEVVHFFEHSSSN